MIDQEKHYFKRKSVNLSTGVYILPLVPSDVQFCVCVCVVELKKKKRLGYFPIVKVFPLLASELLF